MPRRGALRATTPTSETWIARARHLCIRATMPGMVSPSADGARSRAVCVQSWSPPRQAPLRPRRQSQLRLRPRCQAQPRPTRRRPLRLRPPQPPRRAALDASMIRRSLPAEGYSATAKTMGHAGAMLGRAVWTETLAEAYFATKRGTGRAGAIQGHAAPQMRSTVSSKGQSIQLVLKPAL